MADTQKFIDDLITFIAEAEQPKSVTNEIVARVMNFLNTGYKDLLDNRADVATEQAQRKAADKALQETTDALQTALETVSTTANAAKSATETNKASIDKLLGDNASAAIESFNEVITFLSGVKDDASLTSLLDGMNTNISTLVCEVADLETESEVQAGRLDTLDKAVKVSTIDEIDNLIFGGFYLLTSDTNAEEGKLIVSHKLNPKSRPPRLKGDLVQYLFCNDGMKMRRGTFSTQNSFVSTTTTWQPWHVVDELGEKIPKEHVKVTCRFCDNETRGRSAGAFVYVDIFNTTGYPAVDIKQKYKADANGIVEFDVPCGLKYAIYSKFEGLSASFQWVYLACNETRNVDLWNLKIGIGWLVSLLFSSYPGGEYTSYAPVILNHYSDYGDGIDEIHAAGNALDDISIQEQWEYNEYYCDMGPVIATEDTCFIIPFVDNASGVSIGSNAGCSGQNKPSLKNPYDPAIDPGPWQDYIDYDLYGNFNTEKILCFYDSSAAKKARGNCSDLMTQAYIPSYAQMFLLAQNYKAINSIFEEANGMGEDFNLLPDMESNKSGERLETCLTSTPYGTDSFVKIGMTDKCVIEYGSYYPVTLRVVGSCDIYYEGLYEGMEDM